MVNQDFLQWFTNWELSEFEPIAKRGSIVLETSEEEYSLAYLNISVQLEILIRQEVCWF